MKIKPADFDAIKEKINAFFDKHGKDYLIAKYESGDFPRYENVKNLQTRFNFDLFHYSGALSAVVNSVYEYANDEHIATALKKICPKVTKRY
jgi:hypothetical protein